MTSNTDKITTKLFEDVHDVIDKVCRAAIDNPVDILCEADLEVKICAKLATDIKNIQIEDIHVRTQIPFLNKNRKLRHIPDIVLLDKTHYSLDATSELYPRKGFTHWGSAIVLELKLMRGHTKGSVIKDTLTDIKKLAELRTLHYDNDPNHSYFPAVVLLSKRPLSAVDRHRLQTCADENFVALWIYQ